MENYSGEDLLKLIIGSTSFYGETNHDNRSLDNLDNLNEVMEYCLKILYNHIEELRDDYRISGKALADKSKRLMENVKTWADDSLSLYKESE